MRRVNLPVLPPHRTKKKLVDSAIAVKGLDTLHIWSESGRK